MYRRTRAAPQLSDFHKLQRYLWCRRHKNTNFENYIFVDESTVRILEIPLYHSRKRATRPAAHSSTSKIRAKINIWGGISYQGPTPFIVRHLFCFHINYLFKELYPFQTFKCNMDSEFYREVINDHLFPFIGKKFNYDAKLHQDNDTKHNSKICTDALKNLNINWVNHLYSFKSYLILI